MKKRILSVFVISLVFMFAGFVNAADDTMTVEANIFESVVGIDVPDRVALGDLAKGYLSERQDVDLTNTGTTNIVVTPELVNYSDDIFSYLSFKRILDDPLTKVGFFEVEIERPNIVGGIRDQNVYMYLDLVDYIGNINEDMINHEAEVIFWAFEA